MCRAYFQDRINKLQEHYNELFDLAMLNEEVYGSEYNFEPRVGVPYHLYRNFNGKMFLSLIDPPWYGASKMEYVKSVELTADATWKVIDFQLKK